VALVDNDTSKHGTVFHGYVISSPLVLGSVECQAVLIASFGRHAEIREQLAPLCRARGVEIVGL
jgi:hypothetical protein